MHRASSAGARCSRARIESATLRGMFELARVMGTSVRMTERHYGTLVDGAHVAITDRLDAFDAAR